MEVKFWPVSFPICEMHFVSPYTSFIGEVYKNLYRLSTYFLRATSATGFFQFQMGGEFFLIEFMCSAPVGWMHARPSFYGWRPLATPAQNPPLNEPHAKCAGHRLGFMLPIISQDIQLLPGLLGHKIRISAKKSA